jgi:oxalate---CoA ligase
MNNSSPICLREGSGGIPWILVHALSGTAWPYKSLHGCLDADQACWCLEALGLDGICAPYDRVPAMAAHYANLVDKLVDGRPFIVAGWSFGGVIGQEMAFQLHARGADPLLAILDCQALSPAHRLGTPTDVQTLSAFATDVMRGEFADTMPTADELAAMPNRDRVGHVIDAILRAGRVKSTVLVQNLLAVYRANVLAQSRHRFSVRSDLSTIFVKAQRQSVTNDDPALGWDSAFPEGLACAQVPGNHHTILEPPNVQAVVKVVNDWAATVRD